MNSFIYSIHVYCLLVLVLLPHFCEQLQLRTSSFEEARESACLDESQSSETMTPTSFVAHDAIRRGYLQKVAIRNNVGGLLFAQRFSVRLFGDR